MRYIKALQKSSPWWINFKTVFVSVTTDLPNKISDRYPDTVITEGRTVRFSRGFAIEWSSECMALTLRLLTVQVTICSPSSMMILDAAFRTRFPLSSPRRIRMRVRRMGQK
ncbi:hypothetical protein TNCV_2714041 [Trichonephila clavipes]|nr:hypothetical protein TNCV_2714041 [Trichonephila clavipes]